MPLYAKYEGRSIRAAKVGNDEGFRCNRVIHDNESAGIIRESAPCSQICNDALIFPMSNLPLWLHRQFFVFTRAGADHPTVYWGARRLSRRLQSVTSLVPPPQTLIPMLCSHFDRGQLHMCTAISPFSTPESNRTVSSPVAEPLQATQQRKDDRRRGRHI